MKKTILTLLTLMFAITLFGQSWKETRATAYAAEAQKTFNMDDESAARIEDLWIERLDAFQEVKNKVQSGSIGADEKKAMDMEIAQKYRDKMIAILGCKQKEFWEFNKRLQAGN
jgi:hypothetical protein